MTTTGGQKTVTLVTSQASNQATTSTTSSATPSQPSTSLASAGDGPVTSDAALAALAAEAGLIMPSEGDQNNEQTAGAAATQENTDNSALQNSGEGQLGEGAKQAPKTEPGEGGEGKRQEGNNVNVDGSENTIKQEPVDPDGATEPPNPATTSSSSGEAGDTADPLATLASAAINSSLSTTTPTIKTEEPTPTFTNGLNQETVSIHLYVSGVWMTRRFQNLLSSPLYVSNSLSLHIRLIFSLSCFATPQHAQSLSCHLFL